MRLPATEAFSVFPFGLGGFRLVDFCYSLPMRKVLLHLIALVLVIACDKENAAEKPTLQQVLAGSRPLSLNSLSHDVGVEEWFTMVFSAPVDETSARSSIQLLHDGVSIEVAFSFQSGGTRVVLRPAKALEYNAEYAIVLADGLRTTRGALFPATRITFTTTSAALRVTQAVIGGKDVQDGERVVDVPLSVELLLEFSTPVHAAAVNEALTLTGPNSPSVVVVEGDDPRSVIVRSGTDLDHLSRYTLQLADDLIGREGERFEGFTATLYTRADDVPRFPVIPDEDLLTLVQSQTFKYFWDFAHPVSGMARERNASGDLVTSGGSGFGIMALVVGMDRGFITRGEGLARITTVLDFLESADRFHGAWSHWLDGNTGRVIPFSENDNGGDIVETSFLIQGLITFRQYLDITIPSEKSIVDRINSLWYTVEWDWYTREGQNVLYWHWSPDKGWAMNLPVQGYNESLITYILAAASPTHAIEAEVYHQGWARNGGIVSNHHYYGLDLPLGLPYGGPLFFAHYSFLGLDPRGLTDAYADYWLQNQHHVRVNRAYCIDNPKNFAGYSDASWGLTASDNHVGYSAHSPTNDLGVISPTAALSSFPYTPEESMAALKFFYYSMGDRLWGLYGFYDAYNLTEVWVADSYLAIDQGPIIVMIENYRSGLLWELFMSAPEVGVGLEKLGFSR